MAMYRLSASVLSRSQGRSAVAAAAYRAGERLRNARDGMEHDYSERAGVVSTGVMLPAGAPARLADRETLWNTVEAAEKRKDAQLAREVQLALPHELDDGAREELVRGFVQSRFVDRGMVADVAIHAPGDERRPGKGDTRNHHAHVLLTTRSVDGQGFGPKARQWNAKELLESWRSEWAMHVNRALERHEIEARVDHRSLEDRRADHLERSRAALEVGEVERASAHTVAAEALDREPRVYMKREDYQRAIEDPGSHAGRVLRHSHEMIGRAQARADSLMHAFRDVLDRSIDRLDDLLASLRGEERPVSAVGLEVERSAPSQRNASERIDTDDLDAALAALGAGPDEAASRERARQALEDEERRRAEARERERAAEHERQADLKREKSVDREEPNRGISRARDDGMDYGL